MWITLLILGKIIRGYCKNNIDISDNYRLCCFSILKDGYQNSC